MKEIIIKFKKKSFVNDIVTLTFGTAAAQIVNFLVTPFITRIYGPEAYGLMGSFIAIVNVISPIAAMTFPIAIVLPRSEMIARGIGKISLLITMVFTIVSAIIIYLFHQQITVLFNLTEISSFLILIPIVVFFSGTLQILEQWYIRTRRFDSLSKTTFLHALLINSSKIGIGWFRPTASILIILTALSNGIKTFLLLLFTSKKDSIYLKGSLKNISYKKIVHEYKDFPLFRAPEVLINALSASLPVLLLNSLFGASSAGFYSLGKSVLSLPSALISKSVGDVFYPRISETVNEGKDVTDTIKKATFYLALVGLLPFGLIVIFGPWIFELVFGTEWIVAGEYARWIAFSSYFIFLNKPSVVTLPVISGQKMQLVFTILSLILRTGVLILSYYISTDDLITIIAYSITNAILNVMLIMMTFKKSEKFNNISK